MALKPMTQQGWGLLGLRVASVFPSVSTDGGRVPQADLGAGCARLSTQHTVSLLSWGLQHESCGEDYNKDHGRRLWAGGGRGGQTQRVLCGKLGGTDDQVIRVTRAQPSCEGITYTPGDRRMLGRQSREQQEMLEVGWSWRPGDVTGYHPAHLGLGQMRPVTSSFWCHVPRRMVLWWPIDAGKQVFTEVVPQE